MNSEVGLIGLGKMGSNIAKRLNEQGYSVVGYDIDKEAVDELEVGMGVGSYSELVNSLDKPRVIWLSVPSGSPVDDSLKGLKPNLDTGDVVVDAGNSDYRRTRDRYDWLEEDGVHLLDAGCSGGPSGALHGLSIMVGGDEEAFKKVEQLFDDLSENGGYAHFGAPGAGHYVKMVHNGIEYAFMQALGEGFELLAEGEYDDLDLEQVARVWCNGSVIESRLVELAGNAFERNPDLEGVQGYVPDSGEGRWSVETAIDNDVPATAIAHSLFARYRSRVGDEGTFSDKLISMLRHEFGGHDVEETND